MSACLQRTAFASSEPKTVLEDLSLAPTPLPVKVRAEKATGTLKSLNLDTELFERYTEAKDFLADVMNRPDTAANQIAQVMNTITSILKDIAKLQTDLYNAERLKKLEYCIIEAIKVADPATQSVFFARYAELLGQNNA